jgi:hypothetical protein
MNTMADGYEQNDRQVTLAVLPQFLLAKEKQISGYRTKCVQYVLVIRNKMLTKIKHIL